MLKRLAKKQPLKNALSPILRLVFKKALEFLNFFYCAIFGSVILKLLFLKWAFLFYFVILKLILKIFQILQALLLLIVKTLLAFFNFFVGG